VLPYLGRPTSHFQCPPGGGSGGITASWAAPTWGRQRAVCGAERHSPPGRQRAQGRGRLHGERQGRGQLPLAHVVHIVQEQWENLELIIVLCGPQGTGKDTLFDFMQAIFGVANKYVTRTAKQDEVFGQFNSALKHKPIVQLNEATGKDGLRTWCAAASTRRPRTATPCTT
jgi:hypothetical protein